LHVLFGYTTDVVGSLSSLGVVSPILVLLAAPKTGQSSTDVSTTLAAALASVPAYLYYPTLGVVLAWIVLRVAFNREEAQRRAVLARSCTQFLHRAEARLFHVLGCPDPMPALNEILDKQIAPTVDRHIQEAGWPWYPFKEGIEHEVARELARLLSVSTLVDGVPLALSDGFPVSASRTL
jgi:hypothetical protein